MISRRLAMKPADHRPRIPGDPAEVRFQEISFASEGKGGVLEGATVTSTCLPAASEGEVQVVIFAADAGQLCKAAIDHQLRRSVFLAHAPTGSALFRTLSPPAMTIFRCIHYRSPVILPSFALARNQVSAVRTSHNFGAISCRAAFSR